jgi:hypothetical protein
MMSARLFISGKLLLVLLCGLLLPGCQQKHHVVTRGFYYWKTAYNPGGYELLRLKEARCTRLYVRCFDVGWNRALDAPQPVAPLRMQAGPDTAFKYVPVVFITQEAMMHLRRAQVPVLAANMAKLLAQQANMFGIAPDELQIDCDWTATTRDIYFSLLRALKATPYFRDKLLSCTVRLHQVKYRLRSGIPPADRALIMCYNIGNLKQPGVHNSILDAALARDYLKNLDTYPLPVDIALPLYSWCLHFREDKLVGILRDVAPETVTARPLFRQQKDNLYYCTEDTSLQGYSFLAGDVVRVEQPSLKDLLEVAAFTAKHVRNDSLRVLFFHTDRLTLSKYSTHDLEAVYSAYH